MPIPTNTSAATALQITTLPYSITLDAFEVPDDDLWFRFDLTLGGYTALGLASPVPLDTGDYVPRVDIFTGTPDDLTEYLDMVAVNVPWSMPITSAITSYYFRVRRAGGSGPFTEQLRFELDPGPVAAAPAGSIFVNDDTDGFPAAIVDPTTGEVLQAFPFQAGETAGMLPSGISLWRDDTLGIAKLYSPQFALLGTVTWDAWSDPYVFQSAPISASLTTFYIADRGRLSPARNAVVTTVSDAGVLGATTWDLGSYFIHGIAPSLDDEILYYTQNTGNTPIQRWDLVNDVALSDLASAVASTTITKDILVLGDGSVVQGFRTSGTDYVLRYSAAGATLNTYTLEAGLILNRIAHSGDGASFWAWSFTTSPSGFSRFQRIRASDGVVLQDMTTTTFVSGISDATNPGSPTAGVSFSCPFIETPEPLPPITFEDDDEGAASGVRYVDIRRQRRAPHLSDEQQWTFHRRFQLDLETGIGLSDGQGSDPQLMLRWSDDGGHTWSNEHWMSAGKIGEYTRRAVWRQLGRSRDRVYEVTVTDPVAWAFINAYLDVDGGMS